MSFRISEQMWQPPTKLDPELELISALFQQSKTTTITIFHHNSRPLHSHLAPSPDHPISPPSTLATPFMCLYSSRCLVHKYKLRYYQRFKIASTQRQIDNIAKDNLHSMQKFVTGECYITTIMNMSNFKNQL